MKTFPIAVITVFLLLPFFFFGMVYPINPSSSRFLGSQEPEPHFLQGNMDNFLQKPPEIRPLQFPSTPTHTSSSSRHENVIEKSSISTTRQSKFFPFFMVQFPNEPCGDGDAGGKQHGICVSAKDCRMAGGTAIGICAQGFGACCKYVKACGSDGGDIQVRENSTEIKSVNGSSSCRFILPRTRGICQVRLDFISFRFGQALPNGDCGSTKIEITFPGGVRSYPNLCGNLTGQHLHLTYATADKLYINSGEPTSPNDTYSIRISYIRCDSQKLVPPHCAQYYTGNTGQIRSFNWPHQQLNNLDYTICVADPQNTFIPPRKGRKTLRQQKMYQEIHWSTCGSLYFNGTKDFFISGKLKDPSTPRIFGDPESCENKDYIQVFGGNKQCGSIFKNETISSPPYLLRVKFNEMEMPNKVISVSTPIQNQSLTVGRPEKACKSLNTEETECEDYLNTFCKCARIIKSKRGNLKNHSVVMADEYDEGNTGFCLSYKIVN